MRASAFLTRFTADKANHVGGREYYGVLLEQFVAQELLRQRSWSPEPYDLFHYRTSDGAEVDLIAELSDGRLIAIEVKSALEVDQRAWESLARLRDRVGDRMVAGVVLHPGRRSMHLRGWLHLLPVNSLWEN